MSPLILVHSTPHCWIELCIHDDAPLLPVELPKVFLRGTTAAVPLCVDLIMTVRLEDVKDLLGLREVTDTGSLFAITNGHGPEDYFDC